MKKLILITCLSIFIDCNNKERKYINQNSDLNQYKNDWKLDKNGCLNLRNIKLADSLISKFDLTRKSKEDFLKVFGEPNKFEQDELIYYFDCACDENSDINGDKCYATFYFKDNKLNDKNFACE
jgi:hypothetical protein